MNIAEIDFQQLRIKHILYKSKVRSVLYVYDGEHDASFFSASPVNEWFNAVGLKKYRQEPDFQALLDLQKELDNTARHLFSLYKSGKIEEALAGLSLIEDISQKFINKLSHLEARLK